MWGLKTRWFLTPQSSGVSQTSKRACTPLVAKGTQAEGNVEVQLVS